MRKTAFLVVLALILALWAIPVNAAVVPALPHAFYGSVVINGSPAPIGTSVEAIGTGVTTGIEDNPIITTAAGVYGTSDPFSHRLLVQGDIADGATITFYVNGVSTGLTAEWHSGLVTQKNLTVTIGGGGGGGGGGSLPVITTDFFGNTGSIIVNSLGVVQETYTVTSPDGKLTITIPKGTKALDKDGTPLTEISAVLFPNPPAPSANSHIIGLAYDFKPNGATFIPPITFTWTYDPAALLAGVAEEDLVIAYYDVTTSSWIEVPCVVDTVNHTITASISHFTIFAIIGISTAMTTTTIITTTSTTTSTTSSTTTSTTTPISTSTITSTTTPVSTTTTTTLSTTTTPTVTIPTAPPVVKGFSNWLLVGGIIGGVLVLVLIIVYFVRRRD